MQDSFDKNLTAMTDDARRAEAIRARQQRADREVAAALSGTFAGTLVELAETGSPVNIRTRSGSAIRGVVEQLGPDVVVVAQSDGSHQVLVRRLAIETLIEQGSGHDRHHEPADEGPKLAELLDELSSRRERIAVTLSTGNHVMGSILRVGVDQVVLRLDGDADTATVPLFAIDQVVLAR